MAQPRSNAGTSSVRDTARAQSLDEWCAFDWDSGVQVPNLSSLARLLVRTRNTVYELIVLDPVRAEVMVRGGRFFPEFTKAYVCGSSLGGGFVKLHGIHAGFCLELHSQEQAVVTSPVREIIFAGEGARM
jgi:hypothetical protein